MCGSTEKGRKPGKLKASLLLALFCCCAVAQSPSPPPWPPSPPPSPSASTLLAFVKNELGNPESLSSWTGDPCSPLWAKVTCSAG